METLTVLFTSDTHAHWLPNIENSDQSLVNTAALLQKRRNQADGAVLQLDLGDFIQGSAFATYTGKISQDASVYARAMNQLSYDYQLLGNHEFNFGLDYLASALDHLKAQVLCANLVDTTSKKPLFGKAYDIKEIEGLTLGIIGVTTHYIPHWELPENYQGVEFLDASETVSHYVDLIKDQVDLLIVAYHGGFEKDLETGLELEAQTGENQGYRILEENPAIDLLLTGHQHRLIMHKFNESLTLQPGYGGESVGEVTIHHAKEKVLSIEGGLHPLEENLRDPAILQTLEPEYSQAIEWLNHTLGQAKIDFTTDDIFQARQEGHPFTEFLNQLMIAHTGADFAGVSILNEKFHLFSGNITNELLLETYPYYNRIAEVELTGQDLYDIMEYNLAYFSLDAHENLQVNPDYLFPKPRHYNYDLYSGFKTVVNMKNTKGKRVEHLIDERTGQPLKLDQVYKVAVTQYRAVGGGDYTNFGSDKILDISQQDMAGLIKAGLSSYTDTQWNNVNQNYHHLDWQS